MDIPEREVKLFEYFQQQNSNSSLEELRSKLNWG